MGCRTPESLQAVPQDAHALAHGIIRPRFLYDYAVCEGFRELEKILQVINENGYHLISVTQTDWMYTVFFRRPAG